MLGLQAAIADGTEQTFDGQPMQVGTHLRWSFAPEFGFPPGAFWLARREAVGDKGPIEPPEAVSVATRGQGSKQPGGPNGLGGLVTVGSTESGGQSQPCRECECGRLLACVADAVKAGQESAEQRTEQAERAECKCSCCGCCRCDRR